MPVSAAQLPASVPLHGPRCVPPAETPVGDTGGFAVAEPPLQPRGLPGPRFFPSALL